MRAIGSSIRVLRATDRKFGVDENATNAIAASRPASASKKSCPGSSNATNDAKNTIGTSCSEASNTPV
jgi:uncharacterized membrane protein